MKIPRQQLLNEIEAIAPFSTSLLRLSDIIMGGEFAMDDVCRIIRMDQVLTLDVIGYANSVESGPLRQITSVQDAIVRMGGARIMRFLLAKWFRGSVASAVSSARESLDFWKHGVYCAVSADLLTSLDGASPDPIAYTTCILHDIGKLPLSRLARAHKLNYSWVSGSESISDIEQSQLGWSHAEVGALILEQWHFPKQIVEAVKSHCNETQLLSSLAQVVRMANQICQLVPTEQEFFSIDSQKNISLMSIRETSNSIFADFGCADS